MAKDSSPRPEVQVATHDETPADPDAGTTKSDRLLSDGVVAEGDSTPNDGQNAGTEADASRAGLSEPMTASNSTSSLPSAKDAASGPSPYGTRSRNRAGASRPNYAEDRETELDFELQPLPREDDSRKAGNSHETPADTSAANQGPSSLQTVRRGNTSQSEHLPAAQATAKDQIPGTSTFSANPAAAAVAPVSKKRKAAQSIVPATQLTANSSTPAGQPGTRRGSISTQVMNGLRESCMLSFEECGGRLKNGKLVADDNTVLGINDHVYLICEPPGEPYYLGRIMEFLHVNNDSSKPVDALRMNWYYRPKDIGRRVNDTRLVFASMHSDTSPLTALRGVCQIKHKSEVANMDDYRRQQNCFWYEKLYDRYIHRYYEVIPTSVVVNVPAKVKRVLDDRWKFILVESGRGKELTSAVKSCRRCSGYCASNNSVDCAVCRQTYHMNCVRPPLLKKPSRGFAWACGPCSRAQERKLQERNTPNVNESGMNIEDDEIVDDDEDEGLHCDVSETGATSPSGSGDGDMSVHPGTVEQIHQASLWPFRYLGIHCRVEDALDYDDRIYPRASSRLGTRHQAEVAAWPGRPFTYVKPLEVKRKYTKGGYHKKDSKLHKETTAATEAEKLAREKRPKWVVDEPAGYVTRGEDFDNNDPKNTATLLYKPSQDIQGDTKLEGGAELSLIDDYMVRAGPYSSKLGVTPVSVNFMDKAINLLWANDFDPESALKQLSKVERKELKEPDFTPAELKKFEDGIAKFGSELHSVKKHVRTVSAANIVRFYYVWKKSERGKQVWGSYSGRKGKKEAKKAESAANVGKLQDDVADDHDDSAFDNEKAAEKKRGFQCKFCTTRSSRQWRRAPNTPAGTTVPVDPGSKANGKDKSPQLMVALCINCAVVWRKYAVQWEESEGKNSANGPRGGKRKAEDPLREFQLNEMNLTAQNTEAANTPTGGTPAPQTVPVVVNQEPARKKIKSGIEKDLDPMSTDSGGVVAAGQPKKKAVEKIVEKPAEKPATAPLIPEMPKPRLLPCAICHQMEPLGEQHVSCKECRMTVHRNCYGVMGEPRGSSRWVCDMCSNDRNPQISVQYQCVLCSITETKQDFVEPPKTTHKKKSEREREKDRIERESAEKAAAFYQRKQEESGRPPIPREPLKRTAHNNWVHVTCAVWTPEVKFGLAKALEPSENIGFIPASRYDETCKICEQAVGACVACASCKISVHVECAHQNDFVLGFDIVPVKASRKDTVNTISINGEAGSMTAAIWCKDHVPTKTIVHHMHDIVDETGLNALQLYVQNFKQADLTLTGTVRKATLVNQSTKISNFTTPATSLPPNRRASTATVGGRGSISIVKSEDSQTSSVLPTEPLTGEVKHCVTCDIDTSPRWWPYPRITTSTGMPTVGSEVAAEKIVVNGHADLTTGDDVPKQMALATAALEEKSESSLAVAVTGFQCHKCHHNKVEKPPPSPPKPAVVPRPMAPQLPPSAPLVSPAVVPSAALNPAATTSRFAWSQAPVYSPPAYHNSWSHRSPAPPPGPTPHYGSQSQSQSQSPHVDPAVTMGLGPQPSRPPIGMPQSPHMNGLNSPSMNGYQHPQHRPVSNGHSMSSGSPYLSYVSTRPTPHHLTNGGPPPRAPEPFGHTSHTTIHRHSPYSLPHANSPTSREAPLGTRDPTNQNHGPRPSDGRVNGGASASPSLQNLLS